MCRHRQECLRRSHLARRLQSCMRTDGLVSGHRTAGNTLTVSDLTPLLLALSLRVLPATWLHYPNKAKWKFGSSRDSMPSTNGDFNSTLWPKLKLIPWLKINSLSRWALWMRAWPRSKIAYSFSNSLDRRTWSNFGSLRSSSPIFDSWTRIHPCSSSSTRIRRCSEFIAATISCSYSARARKKPSDRRIPRPSSNNKLQTRLKLTTTSSGMRAGLHKQWPRSKKLIRCLPQCWQIKKRRLDAWMKRTDWPVLAEFKSLQLNLSLASVLSSLQRKCCLKTQQQPTWSTCKPKWTSSKFKLLIKVARSKIKILGLHPHLLLPLNSTLTPSLPWRVLPRNDPSNLTVNSFN